VILGLHDAFDGSALALIAFVGGKVVRFFAVLQDFPLHRHLTNGRILYPRGYEPAETEKLKTSSD
jgi:hypothetical protein